MNTLTTGVARLAAAFAQAGDRGERILIGYLTAMDPAPVTALRLAGAAVAAGADLLEIGLPAPDPHLDGPLIRRSHQRALAALGGRRPGPEQLADYLAQVAALSPAPLLLMGYAGAPGAGEALLDLLDRLPAASVAGLVLPDLEPEAERLLAPELERRGVALVRFVDPAMQLAELPPAVAGATGMLYARTYRGATGATDQLSAPALAALRAAVRSLRPELPVVAGFGIARPEDVRSLCRAGYDGVVVGSALVARVEAGDLTKLEAFVRAMKAAAR